MNAEPVETPAIDWNKRTKEFRILLNKLSTRELKLLRAYMAARCDAEERVMPADQRRSLRQAERKARRHHAFGVFFFWLWENGYIGPRFGKTTKAEAAMRRIDRRAKARQAEWGKGKTQ